MGSKRKIFSEGFGYLDAIIAVAIVAMISIVSIKFIEVKYTESSVKTSNNNVYLFVKRIKYILSDKHACEKNFSGKNIVKHSQKFRKIKNSNGTNLFEVGRNMVTKLRIDSVKTENITLNYGTIGVFNVQFDIVQLNKGKETKLSLKFPLHGRVNSAGKLMECYYDDDGFIVRSLKSVCRKINSF